jgi:hypothetical protein
MNKNAKAIVKADVWKNGVASDTIQKKWLDFKVSNNIVGEAEHRGWVAILSDSLLR